MNIFGAMYDKTMQWSKHRFAVFWLSFVSFIEAIFFPIPPDVMLIPMSMSKPKSAFRFALYTTIASVVGGMIGYAIGYYAFDWVQGYIQQWGYQAAWEQAMAWWQNLPHGAERNSQRNYVNLLKSLVGVWLLWL